jgi:hypothetical protein
MWLNERRFRILGRHQKAKQARRPRKAKTRLYVEELENRLTPAVFNAHGAAQLILDIHAANTNGASANTINLTGPGPYVLTKVDNTTDGPNGLPVIDSRVASTLTINGNGNTIQRISTAAFRFFDIAAGSHGSLVLENVTLRFGAERGAESSAEGGAIFNNGTLKLNGDVQILNDAVSTAGGGVNTAAGGGIYCSAGSKLALDGNNFFEGCHAIGGRGLPGENGGNALGGAIFDNTTTATSLTSTAGTVIEGCAAFGGTGGAGGSSLGGGAGGSGGSAAGGGLFLNATSSAAGATLTGITFKIDAAVGGNGGAGGTDTRNLDNGGAGGDAGSAAGGGIAAKGGTVTDSVFLLVEDCEAVGGSGGNGNVGTKLGNGGNGGNGGLAGGGGVAAGGATLTLSASPILESNFATGGGGGAGGPIGTRGSTGGNGGNSGIGLGGGLYAAATGKVSVTLNGALVSDNTANELRPGDGGRGFPGDGGAGGSYTGASGGGIYLSQNASLASDIIQHNIARASFQGIQGAPSNAGNGADGGAGGTAGGGGLYLAGGTVKVASSFIEQNQAEGTAGGNATSPHPGHAGLGGAGQGGGVDVQGGTVTISESQIENNTAQGGDGGGVLNSAGAVIVGDGALAGGAAGGGIYVGGGTVNLTTDVIQFNQANAGFDSAGKGLRSELASGGGLYAVIGTTVTQDTFTSADLLNNTDSNNDGNNNFGSGGPI